MRLIVMPAFAILAAPIAAQASEPGFFAGVDVQTATVSGSSNTTDGGAAFGLGGVVHDVDFGEAWGLGGHIGYRINSNLSATLSYMHAEGEVDWRTDFPKFPGSETRFAGKALSDAVLMNVIYDRPLSSTTVLKMQAGVGVAFNTLSDIVETLPITAGFVSNVADNTKASPTARIGVGLHRRMTPDVVLGLDGGVAYGGEFETGKTRSDSAGVTDINPYALTDVWRMSLGVSLSYAF